MAIARIQPLKQQPEYTGTTIPFRIVSLRSQVQGQLLTLSTDVGDAVRQGQTIGQVKNQQTGQNNSLSNPPSAMRSRSESPNKPCQAQIFVLNQGDKPTVALREGLINEGMVITPTLDESKFIRNSIAKN